MSELNQEIEEARARVAHLRIKAERPGSRLEDEFALEKARTRLLTLELRLLKRGGDVKPQGRKLPASMLERKRTKHEHVPRTSRERAEAAFAALQAGAETEAGISSKKGGA